MLHHVNKILVDIEVTDQDAGNQIRETVTALFEQANDNEVTRLLDQYSNTRGLIVYNEMVVNVEFEEGQYSQSDIQDAILSELSYLLELRHYHMDVENPEFSAERDDVKESSVISSSLQGRGLLPITGSESVYLNQSSPSFVDSYYYDTYDEALFHRLVMFLKTGNIAGLHDFESEAFNTLIRKQLSTGIAGFNKEMLLLESESSAVFHRIVNLFPATLLKEWLIRSAASFDLEGHKLYDIIQLLFKVMPLRSDFLLRSFILEIIFLTPRIENADVVHAHAWIKQYSDTAARDFGVSKHIEGWFFSEMMIDFPDENIFKNIQAVINKRLPAYKRLLPEVYKSKLQAKQVEKDKLFIDLIAGKLEAISPGVVKGVPIVSTVYKEKSNLQHTHFLFSTFAYLLLYGRMPFWLTSDESLVAAFYTELATAISNNQVTFKEFYNAHIISESDAGEIIIYNLIHLFDKDLIYLFLNAIRDDFQQETTLMQHYFYKYKDALQYLKFRDPLLDSFFKPGFSVYKEDVMIFLLDVTISGVLTRTKKHLFILFMLYKLEKMSGEAMERHPDAELDGLFELSAVWEKSEALFAGKVFFSRDKLLHLIFLLMDAKDGEMDDLKEMYRMDTLRVHSYFDIGGRLIKPDFYNSPGSYDAELEGQLRSKDGRYTGLTSDERRLVHLFGLDWVDSKRMEFSDEGDYLIYNTVRALVPEGDTKGSRKKGLPNSDFMNALTKAETTVLDPTTRMFFHLVFSEEKMLPAFNYINALHYVLLYPGRQEAAEVEDAYEAHVDSGRYVESDFQEVIALFIRMLDEMLIMVHEDVLKREVDSKLEAFYDEFLRLMNTLTDGYFSSVAHLKDVLSSAIPRKQFVDYLLINAKEFLRVIKGERTHHASTLPAKLVVSLERLKLISPESMRQFLRSFTAYYVKMSKLSSIKKIVDIISDETTKSYVVDITPTERLEGAKEGHIFNTALFERIKARFELMHQQYPLLIKWRESGLSLSTMNLNDLISLSRGFRLDDYFEVQVKHFIINYASTLSKPVAEVAYLFLKNFIGFEPEKDKFPGGRIVFYKFVFTLYELLSQLLVNPQTNAPKDDRGESTYDGKSEFEPTTWKLDEPDEQGSRLVNNAGLVICGPYITTLFQRLDLLNEKRLFKDNYSINRGVFILNYLCFGNIAQKEYQFGLNNVLCNVPKDFAYDFSIKLTKKEKDTCESLLQNICEQWEALKSTSPDGLRYNFIIREGALSFDGSSYKLVVAKKPYDILVSRIPWTIGTLKMPWMESFLYTEWA